MDKRRLKKIMLVGPSIMFLAKIFGLKFSPTKASIMAPSRFADSLHDCTDFFGSIHGGFCSDFPNMVVMCFHVFGMVIEKFKVFYSVVGCNPIFVMNSLISAKFSTEMLLHYISVMENSLPIYIYTEVTQLGKTWQSLLETSPIRRNLISTVPKEPATVHPANLSICPFKNVGATINSAKFTSCHESIITRGIINVNTKPSKRTYAQPWRTVHASDCE